jgi:hypothetical protein
MGLASIMPQYILDVLGSMSGVKAIPLTAPKVEHSVGLVVADRDPLSPLIQALRDTAAMLTPATFDERIGA